nr:hypothetical protein Iba_scaffold1678487CG0010 [Ipomoea batatas]
MSGERREENAGHPRPLPPSSMLEMKRALDGDEGRKEGSLPPLSLPETKDEGWGRIQAFVNGAFVHSGKRAYTDANLDLVP